MSTRRVLVTRDPAAARPLVALLRERGLEPTAARLLEAALPEDPQPLRELLREAARPVVPTWLCVTSGAAVSALAAVAGSPAWGEALEAARRRGAEQTGAGGRATATAPLRVAAVGEATARALQEHGVGVDFVPAGTSSAAGMLEEWPEETGGPGAEGTASAAGAAVPRVLLPVSALASTTLADGLGARGYLVRRVHAYNMVPAPAERALCTVDPRAGDAPEIDRTTARSACASGELAAVVVTAPSRAHALLEGNSPAPETVWVAIGEPTARALRTHGITPVTAARPSPEALATAVSEALGADGGRGPGGHSPQNNSNDQENCR